MKYNYKYEDWREAGKLSYAALQYAKAMIKPGVKLIDVAEATEAYIKEHGQSTAFPVNLSINENAAHYTPKTNDATVFSESDVVKIDFGTRKGTGSGDCAITVDLSGRYAKLVEASEEALQSALSVVKAGRRLGEIGAEIEKVAKEKGVIPIKNLGGHAITERELHADIFIPNFDNHDDTVLEEGQIAAIEPFMTMPNGSGYVEEGSTIEIFQKLGEAEVRSQSARDIANYIDSNFGTFPFAVRWLTKRFGDEFTVRKALNEIGASGAIDAFPVLVEKKKAVVAQTEVSFIVEKDSCEVLTK